MQPKVQRAAAGSSPSLGWDENNPSRRGGRAGAGSTVARGVAPRGRGSTSGMGAAPTATVPPALFFPKERLAAVPHRGRLVPACGGARTPCVPSHGHRSRAAGPHNGAPLPPRLSPPPVASLCLSFPRESGSALAQRCRERGPASPAPPLPPTRAAERPGCTRLPAALPSAHGAFPAAAWPEPPLPPSPLRPPASIHPAEATPWCPVLAHMCPPRRVVAPPHPPSPSFPPPVSQEGFL